MEKNSGRQNFTIYLECLYQMTINLITCGICLDQSSEPTNRHYHADSYIATPLSILELATLSAAVLITDSHTVSLFF